jgi:hypothetical protein
MKRWGLRGASVSHDKKHDTGANVTQPPNPQCFIPVVICRYYLSHRKIKKKTIIIIRFGK